MNTVTTRDPGKPRVFTSPEEEKAWHREIDQMIEEVVLAVLGPRVVVGLTEEELDGLLEG